MALGKPGDQLRLFAPASEIVQSLYRGDIGSHESWLWSPTGRTPIPGTKTERETNISMLNAKKGESEKKYDPDVPGSGLFNKISKEGFQGHVQMDVGGPRPRIWEGHHRLGVAHDLGEQFVGLDYVTPNDPDSPERKKPSYEERYPQNP